MMIMMIGIVSACHGRKFSALSLQIDIVWDHNPPTEHWTSFFANVDHVPKN